MIREIAKPRKAAFGFEISMSRDLLNDGRRLAAIQALLEGKHEGEGYFTHYGNSMGNYKFTIYVNDEALALAIRAIVEK